MILFFFISRIIFLFIYVIFFSSSSSCPFSFLRPFKLTQNSYYSGEKERWAAGVGGGGVVCFLATSDTNTCGGGVQKLERRKGRRAQGWRRKSEIAASWKPCGGRESVNRSPEPGDGHAPVSRSLAEPRGPTSATCGGSRVAALPAQRRTKD